MEDNPFLLPRPATIAFSGGRTSGLMLARVIEAFGGSLPRDVVPVFCNTGKEREETLCFVRDCAEHFRTRIRWVEYRWEPGRHYFEEVAFANASRKGEPFEQVIAVRSFLPNPVMRFCTGRLKVQAANQFARQTLGFASYHNAIGLRADEPKRVAKLLKRRKGVEAGLFGDIYPTNEYPVCPLAEAGVTNQDVLDYWKSQAFDLALPVDERTGKTLGGNCDLCFLKGAANIVELIRQNPESADWWIAQEAKLAGKTKTVDSARFRKDRPTYLELKLIATNQVAAPGWVSQDHGGDHCGAIDECACTD